MGTRRVTVIKNSVIRHGRGKVIVKRIIFVFVTEYDCPEDKGKCRDEIQCISLDNFCDGYAHCKDKSDEDPEFCRGM